MPYTKDDIPYSNPTTSRAAAIQVAEKAPNDRAKILQYINACMPEGACCEEMEDNLGLLHQTCSARCNDLLIRGLIEETGVLRQNRTGAEANLWAVTSLVTPHILKTGDLTGVPILLQYRKDPVQRLFKGFKKLSRADKMAFLRDVVSHAR
jgi:hypothetical protein